MTEPTTASLKAALKKISVMDFGPEVDVVTLGSSDALALIVDTALEALNPKSKPSAFDMKAKEVTDFIMANFNLAFAPNDEIAEALNAAGIKSPQGKDWTRSNISKILTASRENIVKQVQSSDSVSSVSDSAPVESASVDTSEAQEDTVAQATSVVETESDGSDTEIDAILSELDDLDDLNIPA